MKRKVLLYQALIFVFCIVNISILSGQPLSESSIINEKLIPFSPTVSSLNNYVDIPVSLYSGTIDLGIPIFEVKTRDISIPISLKYWSSGVKVNEVASPVGINWSLEAGGYISRTVYGIDDFREDVDRSGFIDPFYDHTLEELFSNPPNPYDNTTPFYYYFDNALAGEHDIQPDVFAYNFLGYSGKFIFKQTIDASYQIVKLKQDELIIEYIPAEPNTSNSHFVITTPDGYVCSFGFTADSKFYTKSNFYDQIYNSWILNGIYDNLTVNTSFSNIVTTWGLNSILSPFGDEVCLSYETYEVKEEIQGESDKILLGPVGIPKTGIMFSHNEHHETMNSYEIDEILISEISYNDIPMVEFIYEDQRCDIPEGKRLSEILINDKQGSFFKGINILNSYTMNQVPDDNCPECNYDKDDESDLEASRSVRLWLNGIEEYIYVEGQYVIDNTYQFEYHDGSLPPRDSKEVDYWGYYNGMTSNSSSSTILPAYNDAAYGIYLDGVNKSANINYAKIGALSMVSYPTGGYREFEYEMNDFIRPGLNLDLTQQEEYVFQTFEMSSEGTETVNFTLTEEKYYDLRYRCVTYNQTLEDTYQYIKLFKVGQSYPINTQFVTTKSSDPDGYLSETFLLESGEYYIEGYVSINAPQSNEFEFPFMEISGYNSINQEKTIDEALGEGGGIRIKRISEHFSDDQMQIKEYEYSTLSDDGETISSGIANLPQYIIYTNDAFYYKFQIFPGTDVFDVHETVVSKICRNSHPFSNLSLSMNSPGYVGYSRVIEYDGTEESNNGSTVFHYRSPGTLGPMFSNGFYMGHAVPNSDDGHLLKKEYYKTEYAPIPQNAYGHNIGVGDQIIYSNIPPGDLIISMKIKDGPIDISGQGITVQESFFGVPDGYGFQLFEAQINASAGGVDLIISGTRHETIIDDLSLEYSGSEMAFADFESAYYTNWIFTDYGQYPLVDFQQGEFQIVKEENFKYELLYEGETSYTMFVNGLMNGLMQERSVYKNFIPYEKHFGNLFYTILPYKSTFYGLTEKEEVEYLDGGNLQRKQWFSYNPKFTSFPVQIQTENSDGNVIIEKRKYPAEYVSNVLTPRNILTSPIEKQLWIDEGSGPKITEAIVNEYIVDEHDHAVLDKTYQLETDVPNSDIDEGWTENGYTKLIPTITSGNSEYVERVQYKHDSEGRTTEISKSNDMQTSYIWDQQCLSPIAKIENAEEDEVYYTSFESDDQSSWIFDSNNIISRSDHVGSGDNIYCGYNQEITTSSVVHQRSIISFWAKNSFGEAYDIDITGDQGFYIVSQTISEPNSDGWKYYEAEIGFNWGNSTISISKPGANIWVDELRLYPVEAKMTTYTYDLLNGITSQTDPNGQTTTYEYDDFGRLESIRDFEGNLLKQVKYNYKNN